MDSSEYFSTDWEDVNDAAQAAKISVQVSKNQRNYLLETFLDVFPDFEESAYDSLSHWFLEVPNDAGMWLVIENLRKYFVMLGQIVDEEPIDERYQEALEETKFQIAQLIEYLVHISYLNNNTDRTDEAYPVVPEDLKTDSMSGRQRRDYLVIKNYENLLNLVENSLEGY